MEEGPIRRIGLRAHENIHIGRTQYSWDLFILPLAAKSIVIVRKFEVFLHPALLYLEFWMDPYRKITADIPRFRQ